MQRMFRVFLGFADVPFNIQITAVPTVVPFILTWQILQLLVFNVKLLMELAIDGDFIISLWA